MSYQGAALRHVRIRSRALIERAMKDRDVNGAELARLAETSVANISNIRRGVVKQVRSDTATAIEKALRVEPGTLFDLDGTS